MIKLATNFKYEDSVFNCIYFVIHFWEFAE